jgi:hypothetical protein
MKSEILESIKEKNEEAYDFLVQNFGKETIYILNDLASTFKWNLSPQGENFWVKLFKELLKDFPLFNADYITLIDNVNLVDKAAMGYLAYKAYKLSSFKQCLHLQDAFSWEDTPQGCQYWQDIAAKVEKRLN